MAVALQTLLNRSKNNMASGTHPVVRDSALELIKRAYKEGIYVQISEGYRSNKRQNELYAQGRTKPGNIVTNARAGQSWHNYGVAIDYFLTSNDGSKAIWTVNAKWRRAAAIGKQLGFEWGGDWTSFKDYPHLQMTSGLSLSQLQAGRKPNLKRKFSPSDDDILQLQKDLKKLGYNPGTIDGIDGKNTQKAVKAFQKAEGLTVDGIAGKETKARIKHIKNGGMTMSEYKKVMKEINSLKKQLNKKLDKTNKGDVSNAHKDNWKWAEKAGLLDGNRPLEQVTREQLASVEHSFYKKFIASDYKAEDYAEEALKWAEEHGISDSSNPAHVATRQQVITIVKRAFDLAKENAIKVDAEKVAKEIYPELEKIKERHSKGQ